MKLWRSGLIFSAIQFIVGLGNYAFQGIIGRQLEGSGEFGYVTSTLGFIGLISLPVTIVTTCLVHYIAHYRASGDDARLQGLLSGCRRLLLRATIGGTIIALVLVQPLSRFFELRSSLMLTALSCLLVGLWSGFAVALCQGMGWFKRMALIGLVAVIMRVAFGWVVTKHFPIAEAAVSATTFSLLANFALLYWWKDLFRKEATPISPWNREFALYLVVAAATTAGTYFLTQADQLVAQKYFKDQALDNYTAAAILCRALIAVVGPILIVLFTARSGKKDRSAMQDQKVMLGLYAGGLVCGGIAMFIVRDLLLKLIGRYTPEASAMMVRLIIAMCFLGLLQAIGTWSLASRWFKLAITYGIVGGVYWLTLLMFGKTPDHILILMPIGAAIGFVILLGGWFITTRSKANNAP